MIFEALYDSAQHGELILIDGGLCRFHLRRDNQITIYEIISTRKGAGSEMLEMLKAIPNMNTLVAKCPSDLPSNRWWQHKGFTRDRTEITHSGRGVNVWILFYR